ncbi:hypothetical protein Tco_0388598 [Tanacetum coccineum]
MVPRTVLTRAIHTRFEEKRSDYSISLGNSKGGKLLESVSQMCDKKNSVLFTDTECVVPSQNFNDLGYIFSSNQNGFNYSTWKKNTLAEYMILSGTDNCPPMLDKDLYDSWKSQMELYMQNREHGRMILESVENGPLIWPTVEENGVIRTKKYAELFAAEKIQADCDMKATNIIL